MMSSTHKFNVGDNVKVVSDDKGYGEVRDKILTLIEWYDDGNNIVWHVDYAGKPDDEDFACWESDLVLINVKVVEGVAQYYEIGGEDFYVIDDVAVSADTSLFKSGDEVRITIEVIRKAGE